MKTTDTKSRTPAWLPIFVVGLLTLGLSASKATTYYWYNIGPSPINALDTNQNITEQDIGRVPTLAVDPSNANHWLIGAAQGGIWETSDQGNTWNPRSDGQASLAMGAIAFAPGLPSLVYAGTGEANFRGDDYAGAGLLVSQDGGAHWQMINTNFARTSFSRILVNAANSQNVTVATTRGGAGIREESAGDILLTGAPPRGVFVSTNGGTNFIRALTGEATALVANPNNFNQQYAGLGEIYSDPTNGIYRTTDGWQTSQLISGPWIYTNTTSSNILTTNICINCSNSICVTNICITFSNYITGTNLDPGGRIAMAESPSDPNTLYVGVAEPRFNYEASLRGIWVTTNAWAVNPSWNILPPPPFATSYADLPRFWYMFDLLVDPFDPTVVYLAEFDVWRYRLGNWSSLTVGSTNSVHPDNHFMAWVPGSGFAHQMLLGNDGGVYLSDSGVSGQWTNRNAGLRITQFYKGAIDPTGQNVLALGGAQDDFTSLYTGSTAWPVALGGDGGDCAVAATDPLDDWALSLQTLIFQDKYFNVYTNVTITKTITGVPGLRTGNVGNAAVGINDALPIWNEFYVHFEKAPFKDDLLIAGTGRLWRCDNFFSGIPSWLPNSPTMFDTNGAPVPISAMAFAPSDARGLIYAYGTEDGQLRITSNGGTNWNDLDPGNAVPGRYVSGLAFSPVDSNTLYVTLSGLDEDTPAQPGHMFKTGSALAPSPVWTNVSPPVDLPNDCLAIDPNIPGNIYVGTDIGIWNTPDGGISWIHYGPANGLPNVAVYDLRFNSSSGLTAFTHGRGAYLFARLNIPVIVGVKPPFHPIFGCLTCPPDKFRLNPGDEITIVIPLQGALPIDTVDLQATMLPSPQVTPITGSQDYGLVKGQGPPVTRVFRFIAGGGVGGPAAGSCGGSGQVVLQLQDQGVGLGQVTIPFELGVASHPLVEDFEEVPPPALSPGWFSTALGADPPWATSTNPPPNVPVGGGEDDFAGAEVVNTSVVTPDAAGVGQSFLMSPPFQVNTPQAQLYFREAFAVSNAFDGGILEIAIGAQPFQEITQTGGSFVNDGYNSMLSDFNPLGPRAAWSGNSGGWVPVIVNLPSAAAGQTVQLRWHFATSRGQTNGFWAVDSVLVTESLCLPPVSNPIILSTTLSSNQLTFTINTVAGRNYIIEYKGNLTDAVWQTLETIPGNNSPQVVSVPIGPDSLRFYRFEVQ